MLMLQMEYQMQGYITFISNMSKIAIFWMYYKNPILLHYTPDSRTY